MCGFCGIFDPAATGPVDMALVAAMTRLMAERGPDAEGLYSTRRLGLGHRRLTIIDLEAGEQPVFNEDESVMVVFNGEIFNYQEIRASLEARGHRFRTRTDTEVIVHAWEEYGARCVEHFRGMFAFCLYDQGSGEIFLARDRLGVKPLYYTVSRGRLLFASEIKPLLLALGGEAQVDPAAVEFFVSIGYVPGERTVFKGIRKLLPGHTMQWAHGEPRIAKYWDVPDEPVAVRSIEEAEARFLELLRESVRLRLISDVPLGAFLSGGLDSSVIVAQMCELSPGRVKTFSVGYADSPELNELPHARKVAAHLGTDHVEHVLTHSDFFGNLNAFVYRSEEPIVESAGIALYELARRARRDVTVVLSGEGGDEVLAGYPLYRIMTRLGHLRPLARMTGAAAVARAIAPRVTSEKLAKYLDWAGTPLKDCYWSIPSDVTPGMRERLFTPEFRAAVGDPVAEHFHGLFEHLRHASMLKRMSYVDIKSWLPDDLLIKADKMTMAASVELRVPFLDHKLLEFCLGLPDDLRLRGGVGKYLLKRAAGRWLPESIVHRRKQGFPVPVAQWFRGHLHERIAEILLDARTLQRGYVRPDYVRGLLRRHREGDGDHSRRLLTLVILEIWHRAFLDDFCGGVRSRAAAGTREPRTVNG